MAMRADCIKEVEQAIGRPLKKAEAQAIEDKISFHIRDLARTDPAKFNPMTEQQRQLAAAQAAMADHLASVDKAAQRKGQNLLAQTRELANQETRAAVIGGKQPFTSALFERLRQVHRNPATGGYAWTLRDGVVEDATNHCYGVAFVLLAYSCALKAGISDARGWMDETWQLLELRFWEPSFGLYKDEADANWTFSDYRGQNANMHMCEAMLAAFEASGEDRYLQRALLLADHMTRRQAAQGDGLVWEHYDLQWRGLSKTVGGASLKPQAYADGAPGSLPNQTPKRHQASAR